MIGKIVEVALYCIMAMTALCVLLVLTVLVSEALYELSYIRRQKREREQRRK